MNGKKGRETRREREDERKRGIGRKERRKGSGEIEKRERGRCELE